MRHPIRTGTTAAVAALLLAAASAAPATGRSSAAQQSERTYTNPVSAEFADTFADPSVIRGKDGWWYAVGTTDPLREGEGTRHLLPMARSADLVDWEYIGDAFTESTAPGSNFPRWAATDPGTKDEPRPTASIWAGDLRYVDGQYRLYYVVTETTVTDEPNDNAVGMATSDSPFGPWVDSGAPVVGPRRGPGGVEGDGNFLWTFDPNHVRDEATGKQYLTYGSYYGGIWATALNETGTRAVGEATQITINDKYEGSYIVQRDGFYYLFVSSANCCNGAVTGYSVHVGRSRSITGPYEDKQGYRLDENRAGGTPVIAPNGNRWIGTGHNAVVTDLAGQDWIVYHALDRNDPYLDGVAGVTERPMLIDRLDWVDGWPTARAGLWASDDEQPAPLASGRRVVTGFEKASGAGGWRTDAGWTVTGGVAEATGTGESRITRPVSSRDGVRVEADVRVGDGRTGLLVTLRGGSTVRATVDAAGTVTVSLADRRGTVTGAPEVGRVGPQAGFDGSDWHSLVLVVAGGVATAELSDARLNDPLAQTAPLDLGRAGRSGAVGRAGAIAVGAGGSVDNLSVAEVAEPVAAVEPEPLGVLDPALTDEFDGPLDERWKPLRDPQVTVADGQLSWGVQYADLGGSGPSTAALLLQDAPDGDWTVETSIDVRGLGVDDIRNFQQGGIVVYSSDDRWVRLSTVAIWNTRQNEFGVELPWPTPDDPDGTMQGGTIAGPPGEQSWLRVQKRTNAETGEVVLTSFTSNDNVTWVQGGAWTMPASVEVEPGLRVGLFSGGATEGTPPAELSFDYLRWYLP